jgi:hypothetical protein
VAPGAELDGFLDILEREQLVVDVPEQLRTRVGGRGQILA